MFSYVVRESYLCVVYVRILQASIIIIILTKFKNIFNHT